MFTVEGLARLERAVMLTSFLQHCKYSNSLKTHFPGGKTELFKKKNKPVVLSVQQLIMSVVRQHLAAKVIMTGTKEKVQ